MLTTWLVPWSLIDISLPSSLAQKVKYFKVYELKDITQLFDQDRDLYFQAEDAGNQPIISTKATTAVPLPPITTPSQNIPGHSNLYSNLLTYWPFLFSLIGGALFILELYSYRKMVYDWTIQSKPAPGLKALLGSQGKHIEIRYLESDEPGMTTGLVRPIIWIREDIQNPDIVQSILIHEMTHIQQKDVAWLWIISFFKKVFWWNPIVWHLCYRCRDEIEFSCDEKSQPKLSENLYVKSLARLILSHSETSPTNMSVPTVKARPVLNITRLKWLGSKKTFSGYHLASLAGFFIIGTIVCVTFAYDLRFRDFFREDQGHFAVNQGNGLVKYKQKDKIYVDFMQHVYNQDYRAAEKAYPALLQRIRQESPANRERGFHVAAAYLGDTGQHEKILILFDELFEEKASWTGISTPKLIAISLIILERYDEAIELLKKNEAKRYIGYPNRLMMSQAYHLKGDYLTSIAIIEDTLNYPKRSTYNNHLTTMLKLLGKNAVLTNNDVLREKARTLLDAPNDYDFSTLSFNHQRIPHYYFSYTGVNNEPVKGFDVSAFPLRETLPTLENRELQNIFRSAIRAANKGDFTEARKLLTFALSQASKAESTAPSDTISILEYLFIVDMRLKRKDDLTRLSREIVKLEGVSKDILARAHWILSSGRGRYTLEALQHFNEYEKLLEKPTLASDHEKLERFYLRGKVGQAKEALNRVTNFYKQNNVTPDIVTLNRIIGHYEKLGNKTKEAEYRAMFAQAYPNTLNFTLDKFTR